MVAGVLAPWAIVTGLNLPAAILVLAGAWLDSLDGDLAQARQCGTKEGEILDAVLDRYIDFAIIAALIWQTPECLLVGLGALLGSQMVSYLRARTEAAGKASVATFGSRDIRNIILVAGLLGGWYCALLIVLALIANASALHRFYHATKGQT
jgi:phosphatidylglycerophosphate synthase